MLDTFGELSGCYPFAEVGLIGGSFNQRGGQNFLESLQAGTPALMGPFTENFRREVAEALAARVIIVIQRPEDVAGAIGGLLKDRARLATLSQRARDYLARHSGAVARTREMLVDLGVFSEND